MATKKLYLSETDRKIAGVCGGMGEAYGIDPTLCRILWVFLTLVSGIMPGVVLYLIAIIIIPAKPGDNESSGKSSIPPRPANEGDKEREEADSSNRSDEPPRGFARVR